MYMFFHRHKWDFISSTPAYEIRDNSLGIGNIVYISKTVIIEQCIFCKKFRYSKVNTML